MKNHMPAVVLNLVGGKFQMDPSKKGNRSVFIPPVHPGNSNCSLNQNDSKKS